MLGLPQSTAVNRRVAKEKLYANTGLGPQARKMLQEQIQAVIWRHKLAADTVSVGVGDTATEIQVFEVQLRQRGLDKRILPAIAKAIPYKILFMLTFDGDVQAWIEAAGTFYRTDWLPLDRLTLKFEGLDLDAVYANLARQVADGRLGTEGDIAKAVDRDKRRQKLTRQIAALEKKVRREKQFNRQVELNGQLKRLRAELEGL